MQYGNSRYRLLLAALLFAAMIPSCKSPTTPTKPQPTGPTLTLIVPDSARAFDSVVFRAHYSDPVKSSWKFEWLFGDSSRGVSADTSIAHVYDSAGTYSVQVTLVDSAGKTIAQQTGKISILPLNAPTLTLTVPAINLLGDSCGMIVQSSQPLKASWVYKWTFGDGTSFTSKQDTVQHYFLNPGNIIVGVDLNDTLRHILLASRTAMVQVTARHFNISLLHTFRSVTIQCYGFYESQWWGENECVDYSDSAKLSDSLLVSFSSLVWADSGTFQNSSGSDSTPYQPESFNAWRTVFNCNLDSSLTMIQSINGDQFYHSWDADNFNIGNGSEVGVSASNIYFKSSSDTDMVFEAIGISNAQASNWWCNQPYPRCVEWQQGSGKIDFSNSSIPRKVVIRFHN